jgi:uncharacterized Tic20 family protein
MRRGALAIIGSAPHARLEGGFPVNVTNTSAGNGSPLTQADRTWGMIAHLAALAGLFAPVAGNIIGPLVVWLAKRDQSAFVAEQAKEALNFNISVALGFLVCALFVLIFIGFLLGAALYVLWLVMTIIAAIKASEGVHYRYPFALRLIK